jgi:glycosyltransferase involved in cell wall biosynthesis
MAIQKILYISKGESSPSTRYRSLQYAPLYEASGWEFKHLEDNKNLTSRISILKEARKSDVVVILRRTYSRFFFSLIRYFSKYLVFDFDDAIFQKSSGQVSKKRKKSFAYTITRCEQIWAGNSYLAEHARRYNKKVEIFPTSLAVDKYKLSNEKPTTSIDLVWIGSSSTKKHLITVLPTLEEAAKIIPGLRLKIIADFSLHSDTLEIIPVRWSDKTEAADLSSSHVGIAPLPDNPYTQGKCALKVIQYMAASLPVVSSPVGVNKDIVEDGLSGFLVTGQQEWLQALQKLANNSNIRLSMGDAGRKRCIDRFTLQATFRKMIVSLGNRMSVKQ